MRKIYMLVCLLGGLVGSLAGQNGLNFDGTSDFVAAPPVGITGAANRTVECWVKTTWVGTQRVLIDMGALSPNGSRFTLNYINGIPRIEIGGGGINGPTSISDGNWHHLAATYNASAVNKYSLYLDGALAASGNIAQAINTVTGTNLYLGIRSDNINWFQGTMDEVRVWNYARSQTQIAADRSVSYCSPQPGLLAYYKFNQGIPGGNNAGLITALDASGFHRDGTLTSFNLTGSTSNWVTGTTVLPGVVNSSVTASGCASYLSPSGLSTWTASGTYQDTITSAFGCDSAMSIALTILPLNTATIAAASCFSYTSPSGNHTWSTSGTYTDTLPGGSGCDTVLTINLSIYTSTSDILSTSVCDSMMSPGGNQIWTTSGMYQDTLLNVNGCDSFLTVFLTVNPSQTTTVQQTACGSYTWPANGMSYASSGMYVAQLSTAAGCDSAVTLDLTISQPSSATETATACGSYTWPVNGLTFSSSGNYTGILQNAQGCDSIITLLLTVNSVDTSLTYVNDTLSANASPATYLWVDCDNGYQPILPLNVGQSFFAASVSNVACIITQNGCSDTSACRVYYPVAVDLAANAFWQVYPNPSKGVFVLQVNALGGIVEVIDMMGAVVYRAEVEALQMHCDLSNLAAGTYCIRLSQDGSSIGRTTRRLQLLPK